MPITAEHDAHSLFVLTPDRSVIQDLNSNFFESALPTAAGGTYTLTIASSAPGVLHSPQTTGPIPYGVPQEVVQPIVQAAVDALFGTAGPGTDVTVTGITTYLLKWGGRLAGTTPTVTGDHSGLLAAQPASSVPAGTGPVLDLPGSDYTDVVPYTNGVATPGVSGYLNNGWVIQGADVAAPGSGTGVRHVVSTFTIPAPGRYRVTVGWGQVPTNSTTTPYRIYDGWAFLGLVRVDQTTSPFGVNWGSSIGNSFDLGVYPISSGTLRVVLSDDTTTPGKVSSFFTSVKPESAAVTTQPGATPALTLGVGGGPVTARNVTTSTDLTLSLPFYDKTTLPWAQFVITGGAVAPGDEVQVTVPDLAITSAVGQVAGGVVTSSYKANFLPARDPAQRKTLKLGYVMGFMSPSAALMPYANLIRSSGDLGGSGGASITNDPAGLDADGYPRNQPSPGGSYTTVCVGNNASPAHSDGGSNYINAAEGVYTILWDRKDPGDTADFQLAVGEGGTAMTELTGPGQQLLGVATDNKRTYDVRNSGDPAFSCPWVFIRMTGNVTNARVFVPGVPTDGSVKFNPDYLTKVMPGCQGLRPLTFAGINNSNLISVADLVPQSQRSYVNMENRNLLATLTNLGPYLGPRHTPANHIEYLCTFSGPHPFRDGQVLYPSYVSSPDLQVTTTAWGGIEIPLNGATTLVWTTGLPANQAVISSPGNQRPDDVALTGTFAATNGSTAVVGTGTAFLSQFPDPGKWLLDNSVTPPQEYPVLSVADDTHLTLCAETPYLGATAAGKSGSVRSFFRVTSSWAGTADVRVEMSGTPLEDVVDIHNAANLDVMYAQFGHLFDDNLVTHLCDDLVTRFNGSTVRLELSNETWNNGFQQTIYFASIAAVKHYENGGAEAFARRTHAVHNLCQASIDAGAAGRVSRGQPALRLIRSFGSWYGITTYTGAIAAYCSSQTPPVPIDEILLAPYLGFPQYLGDTQMDAPLAAFTADNVVAAGEMMMRLFPAVQQITATTAANGYMGHRQLLDFYGYTGTALACYECGPGFLSLGGDVAAGGNSPGWPRSARGQAAVKHPRMVGILREYLYQFQDVGVTRAQIYAISHDKSNDGGGPGTAMYGTWDGMNQRAGKGDGSDGLFDNRTGIGGAPPTYVDLTRAVSVPAYVYNTWNAEVLTPTVPAFTSASSAAFTVGSAGTFTVSASGNPVPTLTVTGSPPSGVTFTDHGNGTGTLAGTPAPGTDASYPLTLTATNASGAVDQSFTLTVRAAPSLSPGVASPWAWLDPVRQMRAF